MFLLFVLQYNFHPINRKQHAHQCPIEEIDYTVLRYSRQNVSHGQKQDSKAKMFMQVQI
jgi:hypothetical protein